MYILLLIACYQQCFFYIFVVDFTTLCPIHSHIHSHILHFTHPRHPYVIYACCNIDGERARGGRRKKQHREREQQQHGSSYQGNLESPSRVLFCHTQSFHYVSIHTHLSYDSLVFIYFH